jgi:hypothetical protein
MRMNGIRLGDIWGDGTARERDWEWKSEDTKKGY